MADEERTVFLHVSYFPAPESDVEHGQGAIERNELSHAPLTDTTWLIRVSGRTDAAFWEERLNRSADPAHGTFEVDVASCELQERAERGELTFQQ